MKKLKLIYEQISKQISNIEYFQKHWLLIKSMLFIYYFQTNEEKERDTTELKNFEGFQGPDATVLSPLCKQLIHLGWLSPEQIKVIESRMTKYKKQVDKIINQNLLNKDTEFIELVNKVIDKWKQNIKHNFNKWFGFLFKDGIKEFDTSEIEEIKKYAAQQGLYIFKISKLYIIFLSDNIEKLKEIVRNENFKKKYRINIHPSTDYPDFINIKTKEQIRKFTFWNAKGYKISQSHPPIDLNENKKITLKEDLSPATGKQKKYLSYLTQHDWSKLYLPLNLAGELISKAKEEHLSYDELMKIYNSDERIKQYNDEQKRDKIFQQTMIEAKKYLISNEHKIVDFINNALKKSINNKIQPYSIVSELDAVIEDDRRHILPSLFHYIDFDKLALYLKNKYFNNRIGKYFDTIGWPVELMITNNAKVFNMIVSIVEEYLKRKLPGYKIKVYIKQ